MYTLIRLFLFFAFPFLANASSLSFLPEKSDSFSLKPFRVHLKNDNSTTTSTIDSLISDRVVCSGLSVDTLAVRTTASSPDSIAFVYFKTKVPATSPNIIYTYGKGLDTIPITAGNDTVRAFNVNFPTVTDGTPDTLYVYAILYPTPTDTTCRPFDEIRVIINPLPSISGRNQLLCQGGTLDLSTTLNELPTGILTYATIYGTWTSDSLVNPTVTTTYYIRDSVEATTCVDTTQLLVSILDTFQTILYDTVCSGDPYLFNNQNITTNGIYFDTIQATNGCDSFLILHFFTQSCDWGDLPDTSALTRINDYQTFRENNGPSHVIISGLHLGATIDAENEAAASATAKGDGSSDDGIAIFPSLNLSPGSTFRLPFNAMNATGQTSYLKVWIDWNGNGDFEDSGELVNSSSHSTIFPTYLEISVPYIVKTNCPLGVRMRLSLDNSMNSLYRVQSGEVEDCFLPAIVCPITICIPVGSNRN